MNSFQPGVSNVWWIISSPSWEK